MKNRVFHHYKNEHFDWRLEAHHSGELLLIDNNYRGACLWSRAIVLDKGDSDLWVCKYGRHDSKFPMPQVPLKEMQMAISEFGLEVQLPRQLKLRPIYLYNSRAASGFLEWCNQHPRLGNEFSHYRDYFERMGVSPIGKENYKGY